MSSMADIHTLRCCPGVLLYDDESGGIDAIRACVNTCWQDPELAVSIGAMHDDIYVRGWMLMLFVLVQAVGALEPALGFKMPSSGFRHTTFLRLTSVPDDVEAFQCVSVSYCTMLAAHATSTVIAGLA